MDTDERYYVQNASFSELSKSDQGFDRRYLSMYPIGVLHILTRFQMLAAEIAFNYTASYERYAPGQVAPQQMILWAIEDLKEVTTAPPLLSGPDSRLEASAK